MSNIPKMKNSYRASSALHDEPSSVDAIDPGPRLLVVVLTVFFTAAMAFLVVPVEGAEPSGTAVKKSALPDPNWKPPVTPEIVVTPPIDKERVKEIAKKWGVEIISLNISAGGYMMDFRFRVLDVEKSKIFFDSRIKPLLLVEKSNAKLPVPMAAKVGAFRTTNRGNNIKPDKTYYIVFGNPDAHVKSGDKVTMLLGDERIKDLTVH